MKKKKKCFSSSSEQKEDRLTSLPESIRNHIVSFLPIEDTVKLTILSTQWRNICSCLSNLKFDQSLLKNKTELKQRDFRNLVDRLLINHDNSNVTKFSLSVRVDPEVITGLHINSWISFALKHNVQDLYLGLLSDLYLGLLSGQVDRLPSALFTCNTLIALHLCGMELQLPTVIYFPNIKTLKLDCVKFFDERFTEIFLPRCPALEYLSLIGCQFFFLTSFTISAPNLKVLVFCYYVTSKLEVNLSAPNLQWMEYNSICKLNVSPETLRSLTTAKIVTYIVLYPMSMVTKILMGLCKVTTLSLEGTAIELLARDEALSACFPISCSSLTHLNLEMRPSKDHVKVVVLLLRSYPNLQSLHIWFQTKMESTNISDIKAYQKSQEFSTGSNILLINLHHLKGLICKCISKDFVAKEAEIWSAEAVMMSQIKMKSYSGDTWVMME
ncbi:F-box protein, partial [Thalictrum thalictroides]